MTVENTPVYTLGTNYDCVCPWSVSEGQDVYRLLMIRL